MAAAHTILLVQSSSNKTSRTWSDFETVSAACDGVCQLFEKRLKDMNPSMRSITCASPSRAGARARRAGRQCARETLTRAPKDDINDLYTFIDTQPDLSALVFARGVWRA